MKEQEQDEGRKPFWWELPRPERPLRAFTSDELLRHRARVADDIRYWQSGRLPRSPLRAEADDVPIILAGLRHSLDELNAELAARSYTAISVPVAGVEADLPAREETLPW